MTDIVEKLRETYPHHYAFTGIVHIGHEAADEIESLRQRVADLEATNTNLVNRMEHLACVNGALRSDSEELATLRQQGEPVAFRCNDYGDDWILFHSESDAKRYQYKTECLMQSLYAIPPTCFSAGDMADAQAKAFREGVRGDMK